MSDAHKNFAYSTVATAPDPATTGTSLVVAAGDGALFPTAPFNATVWPTGTQPTAANAEIVRVTVVSTDTLTITRAQEGSGARSIVVGDQIAATITAKTLTDAEAPGTVAALTSAVVVSNTAVETDTLTYTIPANRLAVGTTYRALLFGDTDNIATSGNFYWRFYVDGTRFTYWMGNTTEEQTGMAWVIEILITCRTTGATGSIAGGGWSQRAISESFSVKGDLAVTVDTTAPIVIKATCQMETANAGNIFRTHVGVITLESA